MNHTADPHCDICGCQVRKIKLLKKLRGQYYCQKCYVENRKKHRAETFETSDDKEKIIELKQKMDHDDNLNRYVRKNGHLPRTYLPKRKGINFSMMPKIKGQEGKKKSNRFSSYLTLEEKQNLFKILMKKGCTYQEAGQRVKDLVKEQKRVREYLRFKNKSESEIQKAEVNLMEGLLK